MHAMNFQAFEKNILYKGQFQQFIISPYSGDFSSQNNRIIAVSDKVEEATFVTHRKKEQVLILPLQPSEKETLEKNYDDICAFSNVDATFFSVFEIEDTGCEEALYTISKPISAGGN